MVGMIQILTYMFAFYLVVKGMEILQIGLASNREHRGGLILTGIVVLAACFAAAVLFVHLQDAQAVLVSG